MRWFEKNELKEKGNLTAEQIAFISSPSLTIFAPLNFLVRKHFDYLIVITLLSIGIGILAIEESPGVLTAVYLMINGLLLLAVNYFFIKHGRRLAWNRNKWENFEAFKKSEKKWFGWAIFGVLLTFIIAWHDSSDDLLEDIILILCYSITIFLPFVISWFKKRKLQPTPIKVE